MPDLHKLGGASFCGQLLANPGVGYEIFFFKLPVATLSFKKKRVPYTHCKTARLDNAMLFKYGD